MLKQEKISIKEKIGYALGDGAANIAWRGVATFLLIFYTDVFGISAALAGMVLLVAKTSDGISDIGMGLIGDRTNTKYGKFRPWVLWSAFPLAISLSMLYTTPDLGNTGKVIYAFTTYFLFTLIYTANNIPYGALMAVMTGDLKQRTSLGSYRMVGAFAGGMLVQGALLYLVAYFGNVGPQVEVKQLTQDKYEVTVSSPYDVPNANVKTENGIATFLWKEAKDGDEPTKHKSFSMEPDVNYSFIVEGEGNLDSESFSVINQKKGYSYSIYLLSVFLAAFMVITFLTTRERISPPAYQQNNLKKDFRNLIDNRPWLILLIVALIYNVYNNMKQGVTIMYFKYYLNDELLSAAYLVALMIISIAGAMATAPLARLWGKRRLFIIALLFSSSVNALIVFCGPGDIVAIFSLGIISEFAAAIFPTLFFAMLGDVADYSEWKNGRRATGLVYSAGSFATKFGGGIAGAIIGFVLAMFNYDGMDAVSIKGAVPGIVMLMSWIPALIAVVAAGIMVFYPLSQKMMTQITTELNEKRNTDLTLDNQV
jgi:GPH family glycoside/pentoside/hexuronide:cation symporter